MGWTSPERPRRRKSIERIARELGCTVGRPLPPEHRRLRGPVDWTAANQRAHTTGRTPDGWGWYGHID